MNQITKLEDLAGKTISRAFAWHDDGSTRPHSISLIFDDDTFARVCVDWEGRTIFVTWEYAPDADSEKLMFGLTTQAEIDRREAEERACKQAITLLYQRREYEKLKRIFEPEAQP